MAFPALVTTTGRTSLGSQSWELGFKSKLAITFHTTDCLSGKG